VTPEQIQDRLLKLSHELGREDRQLSILGEGNTSADNGDGSFWVKASGTNLETIGINDVSRIRFDTIIELLDGPELSEEELNAALLDSRVHPEHKKPSIETFLHALCLNEDGVNWVGHTHAVSVNQILCSRLGAKPFLQHVFPDAVIVCGVCPAVVAYCDPGFALAIAVKQELQSYRDAHGKPPKLLLMVNHGPVALGGTAQEVFNIMLMADKWARILCGTYALGGPKFLPDGEAEHVEGRLDEVVRRQELLRGEAG
jgi:rhamnose utilization protein RhaD (predicted bifunctional aldolase and dehydrogenase)